MIQSCRQESCGVVVLRAAAYRKVLREAKTTVGVYERLLAYFQARIGTDCYEPKNTILFVN